MKKLIQTNFTYYVSYFGKPAKRQTGSYLGRGPASLETVIRFLRGNAAEQGIDAAFSGVVVTESFESRWIHK